MTNSIGKRLTYSKLVTRALDLIIARLPDYFTCRVFSRLCKKFDVLDIAVNGDYGTIHGDPTDATIMGYYLQNKTWSNDIVTLIKDCFSDRPGTFLDIGANIGLITLPISFDENIMCKCFEPDPRNFEFLKRNIQENSRHSNIDVHNLALFDREDTLEFELSPENFGDHRIRASGNSAVPDKYDEFKRNVISVQAVTLDALIDVQDLRGQLVAKIDTQGSEAHIMKGGVKVLSAMQVIVFEFWPYGLGSVEIQDSQISENVIQASFYRRFGCLKSDLSSPSVNGL